MTPRFYLMLERLEKLDARLCAAQTRSAQTCDIAVLRARKRMAQQRLVRLMAASAVPA